MSVPMEVITPEAAAAAQVAAEYEATEAVKKLIAKWRKHIEHAKLHDKDYRDRWADDRRVARGQAAQGDVGWLVDTNLIAAIIEVLIAFLYAKDPDVSVRPSKAVNRKNITIYREHAETLEIVVSRLLHEAALKRTAKRWIRGAMTVGINWIKAGMQTRTERDPIAVQQLNDLREQIGRVEGLQSQADSDSEPDVELRLEEMRNNMLALQGQAELTVADGVTLDLMAPEDVIVSPECGPIENYLAAPWIAIEIYKSFDEAQGITGWKTSPEIDCLKKANKFSQRQRNGSTGDAGTSWVAIVDNGETESIEGFLKFVEIWSLRDGVVYTLIEGVDKWARAPYAPRTGKRWYPVFDISFHPIDGERYPQSDVYMLKKLQEEYSRTRSNYAEHRRRAIPGIIFDMTAIEEESVKKLASSELQEYIGIKPTGDKVDLRTLFTPKTYNPVDPGLYDTNAIRIDMEKVSGAQDAMQSSISVEKTATEAKIQDSGFGARVGARRDSIEDSLTEMSEYIAQLALQTMDMADAQKYAGPDAVWTQMTADEALTLFQIEIKAGSTGKPKANSDREIWGTLLPLIQQMMGTIGAARQAGQEWAAKPMIALLEETMKRLDDPADIERFLPVPPPPMPMMGGAPAVGPDGMPLPQDPAAAGAPAGPDPAALAAMIPPGVMQ